MTTPNRFEDLKPTELYRSAIEDFALPVDADDKNKKTVLLAAFLEGGVTWDDYVAQHPEVAPAPVVEPVVEVVAPVLPERVQEVDRGNAITSPQPVSNEALTVGTPPAPEPLQVAPVVVEPAPRIITAERPQYNPQDKLLIKMERDNPLFEVRGHKFTKDYPYALMSPRDADWVLRNETGFRQALPSELEDFYS